MNSVLPRVENGALFPVYPFRREIRTPILLLSQPLRADFLDKALAVT